LIVVTLEFVDIAAVADTLAEWLAVTVVAVGALLTKLVVAELIVGVDVVGTMGQLALSQHALLL